MSKNRADWDKFIKQVKVQIRLTMILRHIMDKVFKKIISI